MKTLITPFVLVIAMVLVGCRSSKAPTEATQSRSHYDQLANVSFPDNQPSREAATALNDELLFQRATQVYMWALPGQSQGNERRLGEGFWLWLQCFPHLEGTAQRANSRHHTELRRDLRHELYRRRQRRADRHRADCGDSTVHPFSLTV
jgi:hypothetical protein